MASQIEKDKEYLRKAFIGHKGKWLTMEAVEEYQRLASKLTDSNMLAGERRKLCMQLMEEYGVTELEAINILNGNRASDYVTKYERIRTQTPLMIKKEKKEDGEKE